jgi:hypothetical protein
MRTGQNWASRPHCPPGSDKAINEHKAYAMNVNAPASKRETKPIGMKGSMNGPAKTIGLTNR